MKVNVGLNKCVRRDKKPRVFEHKNVAGVDFEGSWDNPDDHTKFREKLYADYPGWCLTGYAPVK
jgi:hypothetical protein